MYDREVGNRELTFGISGKLYKQNLLLYDQQTESLWSQVRKEAVTGPLTGSALKLLPSLETSWQEWRSKYPGTLVLSPKTGYSRDYFRDPYEGLSLGDKVIGIEIRNDAKAYPFAELVKASNTVADSIGGQKVTVVYDPKNRTAAALDSNGKLVPSVIVSKSAWLQFHPKSTLFRHKRP